MKSLFVIACLLCANYCSKAQITANVQGLPVRTSDPFPMRMKTNTPLPLRSGGGASNVKTNNRLAATLPLRSGGNASVQKANSKTVQAMALKQGGAKGAGTTLLGAQNAKPLQTKATSQNAVLPMSAFPAGQGVAPNKNSSPLKQ